MPAAREETTVSRHYRIESKSGRVFEVLAVSETAANRAAEWAEKTTRSGKMTFRTAVLPMDARGNRAPTGPRYLARIRELKSDETKAPGGVAA